MKTNIFRIFFAFAIITGFSFSAWGTEVGGIIDTDTVWDLAGSPYNITATVQIDEGVTLTIEPGAVVNNGTIELWGSLKAVGLQYDFTEFNDVGIIGRDGE